MNRAIPAAILTAVGLGALSSFKSTSGLPTKSSSAVVTPRATVPASTAPRRSATTAPATTSPTTPATGPTQNTTPTQTRTFTGDAVDTQYGTVQVQVTLKGSRITNVIALQMPGSHERSIEISQQAAPLLLQEALQAQSAQIDTLSGATYTSGGYAQSLQSALDHARA